MDVPTTEEEEPTDTSSILSEVRNGSELNSSEIVEEDIDVKVILGTEVFKGPDIYELSPGLCRGQMMIVNFEEFIDKNHQRVGSHKDVENLSSLFYQIGTHLHFYTSTSLIWICMRNDFFSFKHQHFFTGFNVNNVPTRGMRRMDFLQTMHNFAADKNHRDIMVLAVMSHSSEEHTGIKILTSDYEELDLERDIVR